MGLAFEVRDGSHVKIWEDVWCGERSLKQDFPDMFRLAADPTAVVASNFSIQGNVIVWSPVLRPDLFHREISRVIYLLAHLQRSHIGLDHEDHQVWTFVTRGQFSLKSCYGYVSNPREVKGP